MTGYLYIKDRAPGDRRGEAMKHSKSTPQRPPRGPVRPGPVARSVTCAVALSLALSVFPALAQNSQTMVTPNYRDVDLGQIVEAVSQVTGRNFIIDPRVKAQVTMLSATPMSPAAFYEAFLAILQVHGFVAVPSGNVIKIIPDANARQVPANDLPDRVSATSDEIVTQVVIVKSVSAAQLVPILRPLIPQYGHLAAYPASNALIISDRANNVNRMIRIIDRIDRASDDEVEVVRLENASAAEVVRVVNALNQAQAGAEGGTQVRLVADDRTNSVLLGGEKSQRLRLRALIAHLDTPLETGGDTQVRYLRYADAEKIATALKQQVQGGGATTGAGAVGGAGAGAGAGAAGRDTVIWADPATNALVVTAPPKVMRELMTVVDKLDIRRAQVLVEAIIVEVTGNQASDLGVNWLIDGSRDNIAAGGFVSPLDEAGTTIGTVVAAALDPDNINPSAVPTGISVGVGRIRDPGTNFAAILRAIRDDGNTNIISTPSTVTLDNQEAQIKVAQEVPFLTGQFSSAQGGNQTPGVVNPFQTIQRQDVGTILKITPQITDDNNVLMKIEVEASSLAQGRGGAVDLITNKRTITTNVLSADGEIIVLGGLIADELREGETRVPLLGRIPVLGNLFKTRTTSKAKTNLMVFIRPKVLMDSDAIAVETGAKYNYLRDLQLGRNKGRAQLLPGERQPTLPSMQDLQPSQAPDSVPAANPSTGLVPGSPGPAAPVIVTPGAAAAAQGAPPEQPAPPPPPNRN
ncbi:MAG: type II secretion system secretin GspD [Pseudomonadota bacterium]